MASTVSGYVEGQRRNYLNGVERTLDEIQVSEISFHNGVANPQLIWQEAGDAPAGWRADTLEQDAAADARPEADG